MQKRIELTQSASSLIGNIYRVMEYYNSRYRQDPIHSIIVTGNGASIAGIHELMNNELGVPARTPNELSGVLFNRQIEVNANILQYVGCFGAVYSPVDFIPEDIKNKVANRDSLMGMIAVFVASIVLCIALSIISLVKLNTSEDSYEAANAKVMTLEPVEDQYKTLEQLNNKIGKYHNIKSIVDTNNNILHGLLDDIKEGCPDSFVIDSITTTDVGGTVNCTSQDKLSSVAALVIRLNLIEDIKNVRISSAISKNEDNATKKRQFKYSISFDFLTDYERMDSVEQEQYGAELLGEEAE